MIVDFENAFVEHTFEGRHAYLLTSKSRPRLELYPHRAALYIIPSADQLGETADYSGLHVFKYQGVLTGGRKEGYEGQIFLDFAPSLNTELVLVLKYTFEKTVGAKAAHFILDYRIINLDTGFANTPPAQHTVTALLTDPGGAVEVPAEYIYRENKELIISAALLSDRDIIVIDRLIRDTAHVSDTGDDVYLIEQNVEVQFT